jgi:iron complex outermembrane recepter protein
MKTIHALCAALAASAHAAIAADLRPISTVPIIVTATRFEDKLSDRPANMTVITSEDIRRSTARTVPDLLSEQAGIAVHDFFGNNAATTTVDLRGFGVSGTQNTLILVDGRPVVDVDLSGVQWSALPLGAIERIEVMRGGGSVLYGGGATAGVINIITVSPASRAAGAEVEGRVGSYATREAQVSATTSGSRAAITFHASNLDSDGYRRNNANRQSTGLADLRWLTETGDVSFKIGADRQGIRLPGARTVQPSAGINQLATDRRGAATPLDWAQRDGNRATLDWRNRTSWGEFTLGGSWRDKTQRSYFDFGGFPDYRVVDLDVWSLTPRAKVDHGLIGLPSSTVVGIDWYRWNYRLRRSNATDNITRPFNAVDAEQDTKALYVQNTTQVTPRAALTLGARRERFALDARDDFDAGAPGGAFGSGAAPGSQRESLWAYEAAARYRLSDSGALIGKTGRSYRYANVDEIYETTTSFTNQFQFLRPQIARSHEAGYEWQTPGVWTRATVFQIDVQDEVHLDPFTSGVGNRNLPPSRRRGLELEGKWQATAALSLRASYTYTDAKFREGVLAGGGFALANQVIGGKAVPLVPRDKLFLSAAWAFTARTQLVGAFSYVGPQYMDNDEANTLGARIPAYTVADVKVVHRDKAWRYSAAVNNITNERYYNYAVRSQFVSDRYNAYPLPERNFSVTAQYSFR